MKPPTRCRGSWVIFFHFSVISISLSNDPQREISTKVFPNWPKQWFGQYTLEHVNNSIKHDVKPESIPWTFQLYII